MPTYCLRQFNPYLQPCCYPSLAFSQRARDNVCGLCGAHRQQHGEHFLGLNALRGGEGYWSVNARVARTYPPFSLALFCLGNLLYTSYYFGQALTPLRRALP